MKIKQDPVTKLWCRSDGAVLMPPDGHRFKKFRWTFGTNHGDGYRAIKFRGKIHLVHVLICRAFNGLAPADRPEVDHIDRCKENNSPGNLRWTDRSLNNTNKDYVDQSIEKYGIRSCEDRRAYDAAKRAEKKAQGLTMRKGPDGKYGWYPRVRT